MSTTSSGGSARTAPARPWRIWPLLSGVCTRRDSCCLAKRLRWCLNIRQTLISFSRASGASTSQSTISLCRLCLLGTSRSPASTLTRLTATSTLSSSTTRALRQSGLSTRSTSRLPLPSTVAPTAQTRTPQSSRLPPRRVRWGPRAIWSCKSSLCQRLRKCTTTMQCVTSRRRLRGWRSTSRGRALARTQTSTWRMRGGRT
mmetsp:Transcript_11083/g.25928  ORF Transcript_11083/g.25928 Transcript_11083/m.25928 type:complete len:201 (+) Transcript_11083:192-794(+)